MAYSDFGLDTTKKNRDDDVKVKEWTCPWCNGHVKGGFSLCFSNFVICADCLVEATRNKKRWADEKTCWKCKGENKKCFTPDETYKHNDLFNICKECIDWGNKIINSNKILNDMNFFQQLYDQIDGIDVTMTIKRKSGRLTISVLPKTAGTISPAIITGTPEELEAGFFEAVSVPIETAKGLNVRLEQFNKSVETAEEKAKEDDDSDDTKDSKKEKPVKKTVAASKDKKQPVKAAHAPEPNLFDDEEEPKTEE